MTRSEIGGWQSRRFLLALALSCGIATMPQPAQARPLRRDAVRARISGNSIRFFSPVARSEVILYFGVDGRVTGYSLSNPGRTFHQTWTVANDGALCRTFPRGQRRFCLRVEAEGDKLRFSRPDGNFAFEAVLLTGDRLPKPAAWPYGGPQGGERAGVLGPRAGSPPAVILQNMDRNGDGRISRDEFRGPPQRFAAIDADKDGLITLPELSAANARGGGPQAGGPAGPAGEGMARMSLSRRLAFMDRNGDGKVSRSEWRGNELGFKRLDRDGDGFISTAEAANAEKKLRSKPLLALAIRLYGVPSAALEHRQGRKGCRFDNRKYRFRQFLITGYSPNCAFGGTVLFTDVTDREWPMLYEIGMTGKLVWQYNIASGVGGSLDPKELATHPPMDASRLPNGDTLFALKQYGIFEVDRAGETVWKHLDDGVSHDVDRLPNGDTIYVRGWQTHGEDQVREVDRNGKIVWSWTGVEQFTAPEFRTQPEAARRLRSADSTPDQVAPGFEGWIHTNAVTRLADGTTMLSLRNFHRIVFVNRRGEVLKTLPIPFVHDPEIEKNGDILACVPPWGSIAEYARGRLVWRMTADDWSERYGIKDIWMVRDANRLPNGNIFVTAGTRLMEIDPSGRPVWQLQNTDVEPSPRNTSQAFYKTQRIAPDGRAYGG